MKTNTIRKLVLRIMLIMILMPLVNSCKEDDGNYVAPITIYEKVAGSWRLSRMTQVDEVAVTNKEVVTEMDLSDHFSAFVINLSVDGQNNPTTFSIEGDAPALLPTSGYWKLDHAFQNWDGTANVMTFYSDAACTKAIGKVNLNNVPNSSATMQFTLTRTSKGVAFVSYKYVLIPNN